MMIFLTPARRAVSELITARREVGLSTTVGDKELAAVVEALAALIDSRFGESD